ncbi:MAG TPA: hypothetical protein DC047_13805 [Blastocatellia bacterium]|nr:hypothetical protein [Blastocatellia bacterium]
MERSLNIDLNAWRLGYRARRRNGVKLFAASVIACAGLSAALATWLPLQLSVVTVFLFAGPHNWFELRYFLMRLPVRLGKSRNFFVAAFAGIGVLTAGYLALPLLYNFTSWSSDAWSMVLASWNTLLLFWLGLLIWLRGRNKQRRDWSWAMPAALGLCSLNWLAPELFSLAIVYLHPLVALLFLDRHLRRTRPEWVRTYHQCLVLVAVLLAGIVLRLTQTPALPDDNGLFWRITQHSGAQLLPGVSSHLLVSVHLFLELLHYGVWIVALPLIVPATIRVKQKPTRVWQVKSVGIARHPRGFPKLVAAALLLGAFVVAVLWFGFSIDYATTRDIYFTVAIAHVLAEAPFLLKML